MSENLKTGLLVFIAALLVVNTVILVTDDGPSYADPSAERASFERTAAVSANDAKKNKVSMEKAKAADPLKTTASKTAPAGPVTTMEFAEINHDFGTITQDSENTKVFEFTNTGNVPLVIANVTSSCGCTIPKKPEDPIQPGETGEIQVKYNTKIVGPIRKTVTVYSNADESTKSLKIKGRVIEEDNSSR